MINTLILRAYRTSSVTGTLVLFLNCVNMVNLPVNHSSTVYIITHLLVY